MNAIYINFIRFLVLEDPIQTIYKLNTYQN